ncbi:hypothetical protein CDAR_501301 [Caerostris darwini]|uniref:Uncharacterized protein n=1 Tax=Caerostris darwini TaxID=1538125 RepID=A0AAV4R3Y4_9ARAC|nr:hypothetical protein CDAR_501301 [Caerostris darwini]
MSQGFGERVGYSRCETEQVKPDRQVVESKTGFDTINQPFRICFPWSRRKMPFAVKSPSEINRKPITPQSRANDAGSTHLKRKRALRSRNCGRF